MKCSGVRDQEIRAALDQHWAASMPTILKPSTASITRTRCWNTRSQASEPAVDATYRTSAPVSGARSGLPSDESLAAVIFGSPSSS
jgi:bacterioferritin-associated ferredoxin